MKFDTYLVTGCSGVLGSRITLNLVNKGYLVKGIRFQSTCDVSHKNHSCVSGDLLDPNFRDQFDFSGINQLIHTAWNVSPGEFWESEENIEWLEASKSLFARFTNSGGKKITGIGSCAEYEWNNANILNEESPCIPNSKYGKSKLELLNYLESLNTPFLWCRLFFLYGSRLKQDKYFRYLNSNYASNQRPLVQEPDSRLDYIHIDDAVSAITNLISESCQGVFNVGSGGMQTNLEVAIAFQKLYKAELSPVTIEGQTINRTIISDNTKLKHADRTFNPRTLSIGIREYFQVESQR